VLTNVVALLIFLPIIRCFLLNVNNTEDDDDDDDDDGVGVDVAIQQKKSLTTNTAGFWSQRQRYTKSSFNKRAHE